MNEFDGKPAPESIEIKEEAKKTKLLGQMVSQRGLTLFEYNTESKSLEEAKFKTTILEGGHFKNKSKNIIHKILEQKQGCIYFQALNRKNALKKLDRL